MANTNSAKKRIRSNERKRQRNLIHRGRARTAVKKARAAMDAGDLEQSAEAVRLAMKQLDHAASKGTIHKRNAARRKSRMMKRWAQLAAQQE